MTSQVTGSDLPSLGALLDAAGLSPHSFRLPRHHQHPSGAGAQGTFVSGEAFARAGQSEAAALLLEAEESGCSGLGPTSDTWTKNGRRLRSLQIVRPEVELGG